ncbi:hypothetical protein [Ruegeria lacuscaerulensis]|uniref:hypothetical protein n=1 Tax=Ruegeria lacuscaerulensis TaxID=55218 RepID=UPI001480610C|nr:hypothetical protein [Ruegeria lacuscaerulensis]
MDVAKLSDPRREGFYNQFKESNRKLAEKFFGTSEVFAKPKQVQQPGEGIQFTLEEVGHIVENIAASTMIEYATECEPNIRLGDDLGFNGSLHAKLQTAIRQRDHAKRNPWQYFGTALKMRIRKRK